jgi:5-methylcytosine-specific restriction endonuclease McrA
MTCRRAACEARASGETKRRWRANSVQNLPKLHRLERCLQCRQPFVTFSQRAFCSTTCRNRRVYLQQKASGSRRKQEASRYARLKNAYREPVDPHEVYDRDKWHCGLCGQPIPRVAIFPHPEAPSIDHVVPLALGGLHEMANVQAAHFRCNSAIGYRARRT